VIECALCGARVVVPSDWARCPGCSGMVFRHTKGPRVLVVHASEEMSQHIGSVLLAEGFTPVRTKNGTEALRLLGRDRLRAVVLDVGLDDVPAFQVIERVRNNPAHAKMGVVLIASVYDRTAYKRRPTSLYGADDYVEQHHIPDMLPQKLGALLAVEVPGVAAKSTDAMREQIQRAEQQLPTGDLAKRAWVLARRVVADIALYHQQDVLEAISGRTTPILIEALDEGRRLVRDALGAEPPRDVIMEAWRDLLSAMTGAPQ
jgi:DNA-binding response OmpR family regulator